MIDFPTRKSILFGEFMARQTAGLGGYNFAMKILSLFANVGIAELLLAKTGHEVVVANELIPQRAAFYSFTHKKTEMITGDINQSKIAKRIIDSSIRKKVDIVMATPPCQGMSTAGKMDPSDKRNYLIIPTVKLIKKLMPKYVFLENVPQQFKTFILHKGKKVRIDNFVQKQLEENYETDFKGVIDVADFGVPQNRKRALMLLRRKDVANKWKMPQPVAHVTLREAIGHLPPLDPWLRDSDTYSVFPEYDKKATKGLLISKWHRPPSHATRHVLPMMHTKEGASAMDNEEHAPKLLNGSKSKGYKNTYKRQWWDKPAYAITRYNGVMGSQENVHPGRWNSKTKKQTDPRVLSIYEIMLCFSIPEAWAVPDWASENFIRNVIGEGIPPLVVSRILGEI